MSYGVFRSDAMTGTIDPSQLEHVLFYNGSAYAAIENGNVVKLDSYYVGANSVTEHDLWKAVTPAANSSVTDIVVVGSVELEYDERVRNLDEFINPANKPARAYHLVTNNKFSVTADALSAAADIEVGNIVELQAGTKLKVVSSATSGSTVVGKIEAIEDRGRYTYYVIRVTA